MAYATVDDLTDYMAPESPPSDAERVLARASEVVDRILIGAVYDVDEDELPTDPAVLDAIKRATLAQAHYASLVPGTETGQAGSLAAVSVGAVSYSFRDSGGGTSSSAGGAISPHAVSVLRVAGLLPVSPWGT